MGVALGALDVGHGEGPGVVSVGGEAFFLLLVGFLFLGLLWGGVGGWVGMGGGWIERLLLIRMVARGSSCTHRTAGLAHKGVRGRGGVGWGGWVGGWVEWLNIYLPPPPEGPPSMHASISFVSPRLCLFA